MYESVKQDYFNESVSGQWSSHLLLLEGVRKQGGNDGVESLPKVMGEGVVKEDCSDGTQSKKSGSAKKPARFVKSLSLQRKGVGEKRKGYRKHHGGWKMSEEPPELQSR